MRPSSAWKGSEPILQGGGEKGTSERIWKNLFIEIFEQRLEEQAGLRNKESVTEGHFEPKKPYREDTGVASTREALLSYQLYLVPFTVPINISAQTELTLLMGFSHTHSSHFFLFF